MIATLPRMTAVLPRMTAVLPRKLRRLGEMDPRELGHRVRASARRSVERATHHLRRGAVTSADREAQLVARLPPAASGSMLQYLGSTVAPRSWLGGGRERRELIATARTLLAERLADVAAEAERLCAHRFELLGHGEVSLPAQIDWHRDPLDGAPWPRRFWADYDLVHDGPSDPKRVLELARHQHLPRLGKAYALLGVERYAREAIDQIGSWIDDDPPGVGVHWHESLEIALRATSWIWTLLFVHDSPSLDEATARRIGASLFAQLDHVDAYPSLYSSPNTHLLGEASVLLQAGILFQGCTGADRWLDHGRRLLIEANDRQVLGDGVHAELSTVYHCYALDLCLQALALAERNGVELPERLREQVAAMARFLTAIRRPDGTLPLLGDDDGGRALALAETSYRDCDDLLGSAAVLLGDPALRSPETRWREESLWLLGEAGWRTWQRLPAPPPASRRASFPEAGYSVVRTRCGAGAQLTFDCGGLGRLRTRPGARTGFLAAGGHSHADALSVTLWAAGSDLLVDPGTYVYNRDRRWRDAFRGTAAHNTVVIDGLDQVAPADTFRWRRELRAERLSDARFDDLDDLDYLAGEHHGYAAAPVRLIHRRRVIQARDEYWLLLDDLRRPPGAGRTDRRSHQITLPFHLPPEASIEAIEQPDPCSGRCLVTVGAAVLGLSVLASAPLELSVRRGELEGPLSWVSTRYGDKRAAPVIVARFADRAPALAMTLLEVRRRDGLRHAEPETWRTATPLSVPARGATPPALALLLAGAGGDDLVLLSGGDGDVELDLPGAQRQRLLARGGAFWASLSGDHGERRLARLLAIDATRFELDGARALHCEQPRTEHLEADGRSMAPRPPTAKSPPRPKRR